MSNILIVLVILTIIAGAITKIVIEKKKGVKCVGCSCSQSSDSSCNCHDSK